jgi:hypothetical protein
LTFNPRGTLIVAFSTITGVVNDVCTFSIAARLSKLALVTTLSTVVLVSKNIAAMFLATVKQARAFVGRNAITFVISLSVTSCTFLYDSGQEPAS